MEKILPWFILKSVPGIGNLLFKRLLDRFKSPQSVLEASHKDLLQVDGISQRLAVAIRQHKITEGVEKDLDRVMQKGYQIVTLSDADYPPLLLQIFDPPPFLYVYGNLPRSIKNIAVVGSRNATNYGISTTKRLCNELASYEITVVSGMARGVDTAAHIGAITGEGKTIAVLGSGLAKIYPPENTKLFYKIAEEGAVISEFPVMAEPEAHNFPIRNRIISGICLGTVIVEATRKSGSLITARLATDQGREVFAVPGSIHSIKSTGTHGLIKEGAKLVENVQDIIEEISHVIKNNVPNENIKKHNLLDKLPQLSDEEWQVVKALGIYPVHIDDIGRNLGIEPGRLSSILLRLELKKIVQQSPGNLFSIVERIS
ncbi:MAG: DNA-processing protein DprA [Desulfobacterales bacterium]|nr:DNA-processing protein DprA [Desulfobacterales bacterium]